MKDYVRLSTKVLITHIDSLLLSGHRQDYIIFKCFREKVVIMSKTDSVKSKSSTTDSRPAWNPSTAVTNKSAQLQSLPGKKRQFANVQSRIRSGIGNRSSNMSHDASNSYRERNDSSAVAACLYPTDHQSPWPAPKELNNTAIGSTDEVPEAKTPARCV